MLRSLFHRPLVFPATVVPLVLASLPLPLGARDLPWSPTSLVRELDAAPGPVALADLDRDGTLDLVYATNDGVISWLEQTSGGWTLHPLVIEADGVSDFEVLDVDFDGDVDVVASERDGDRIVFWRNIDFSFHHTILDAPGASGVVVGDLDGDGDHEIVGTGAFGLRVWAPGSPWTLVWEAADLANPGAPRATDIDRDGDLDLVATSFLDGEVGWYENQGSWNFQYHSVRVVSDGGGLIAAEVADFDRDGFPDIATAEFDSDEVHIDLGSAAGFLAGPTISALPAGPVDLVADDLDRDGDLDLAGVAIGGGAIFWLENGSAGWVPRTLAPVAGSAPIRLAVGDLDSDGDTDVVGSLLGAMQLVSVDQTDLRSTVFFSEPETLLTGDRRAREVRVGDVDRDGDPDLTLAAAAFARVQVLLNDGNGLSSTTHAFDPGSELAGVGLGDFDRDGDLDFFAAVRDAGWSAVYSNDGSGSFTRTSQPHHGSYRGFDVGDLDHDGDLDVVAAGWNGTQTVNHRLLNAGGTLARQPLLASGDTSMRDAMLVDFDRDGDLDVIGARGAGLAAYSGNGSGGFAFVRAQASPGGVVPSTVAVADLDLDGRPDVVAGNGSGSVSATWSRNAGGWAWTETDFPAGLTDGPDFPAVADVDRDGDVDVGFVETTGADRRAGWFRNDREAGFNLADTIATTQPGDSPFVDLDSDGWPDRVITDTDGLKVAWNRHFQFAFDVEPLGGSVLDEATRGVVLRWDAVHLGRIGDADGLVDTVVVELATGAGLPLDPAEVAALVRTAEVWADDGDGVWDDGLDVLLGSAAPTGASIVLDLAASPTADREVTAGFPATFYVVADLGWNAADAPVTTFEARLVDAGTDVLHAVASTPVVLAPMPTAGSHLVTVEPNPAVIFGDGFETGDTSKW